jgi:predicted nucleic acid-binding protein
MSALIPTSSSMPPFRLPSQKHRACDLLVRGMRTGSSILLLQMLAEFSSSVAIRKAGIKVDEVRTTIDAWRAVLPVQGTEDDVLSAALDAVKNHQIVFCDAYGQIRSTAKNRLMDEVLTPR